MISIKSEREIELMRYAGHINYLTHEELKKHIKPGIKTIELDRIAYNFIIKHDCIPSQLGFEGYPNTICIAFYIYGPYIFKIRFVYFPGKSYTIRGGSILIIGFPSLTASISTIFGSLSINGCTRHILLGSSLYWFNVENISERRNGRCTI